MKRVCGSLRRGSGGSMGIDVVVIGSLNRDINVMTPRLPQPGETVTGTGHFFGPGGKGGNQATAVARLGGRVAMVGLVGDDEHGKSLTGILETAGVDTVGVGVDPEVGTGLAVITIDENAENTIVVSSGANAHLGPGHIEQNARLISAAPVVLAQLEVPAEAVLAAAELSTGIFCLNPAPVRPLPTGLPDLVDVLVPNRSELAVLARRTEPETVDEAVVLARGLGFRGVTVVTLGSDGAVLVDGDGVTIVDAPEVQAIDPTGAGDAFCGALAYFLSRGCTLAESVRRAVVAGAMAVTRRGAQTAMPTLEEIGSLLGDIVS